MANMLTEGAAWLSEQLQAAAPTVVTYERDFKPALTITVTVGQTPFEQITEFGTLDVVSRDYIFPVTALGELGEPLPGDKVTDAGEVYEVMAPVSGVREFRYSDHGKTILRVHTKRIKATEA